MAISGMSKKYAQNDIHRLMLNFTLLMDENFEKYTIEHFNADKYQTKAIIALTLGDGDFPLVSRIANQMSRIVKSLPLVK